MIVSIFDKGFTIKHTVTSSNLHCGLPFTHHTHTHWKHSYTHSSTYTINKLYNYLRIFNKKTNAHKMHTHTNMYIHFFLYVIKVVNNNI